MVVEFYDIVVGSYMYIYSGRFLLSPFDQRRGPANEVIRPFNIFTYVVNESSINIPLPLKLPTMQPDLFGVGGPLPEPEEAPSVGALPLSAQIDVMIAEVLLAMSGIEGRYIRTASSRRGVLAQHSKLRDVALEVADETLDRSVADQVTGLLPLCQSALVVREFVRAHSQYHYGLVSHALAAEVRTLLREVDVLVSQLDELFRDGKLTLQKLVFMLQPSTTIIRNLADLCTKLDRTRGGEMLDALYGSIFEQGDAKTRELHKSIFYKALHPFVKMLENWLFRLVFLYLLEL